MTAKELSDSRLTRVSNTCDWHSGLPYDEWARDNDKVGQFLNQHRQQK